MFTLGATSRRLLGAAPFGLGRRTVAIGSAVVLMTYFMAPGASHAVAAAASPTSFTATSASIHVLKSSATFPFKNVPTSTAGSNPLIHGARIIGDDGPVIYGTGAGAPRTQGLVKVGGHPGVTASYNGLSDTANDTYAGGEITPPDQGLCAGYDASLPGDPKVVFEVINLVGEEIYPNGTLARPVFSLADLFDDPNDGGDVRCFYDPSTQAFYFSEIGYVPPDGNTATDLGVLNSSGAYTVYQVDTSLGGVEFGDQPKVGFDKNNVYISTDEFGAETYDGAILIAISKSQLVSEVASPNGVLFGPLSFEGGPLLGLEPAINAQANDEWLLNSNPYDAEGNNLASSNTLGLWEVTGGDNIDKGKYSKVGLQSQIIGSETYGFPVDAQSTGNGSISVVYGYSITSESALNPDDDRMLQVVGVGNGGDERLYASLDTDITPSGDSAVRDGAAWFQIRPSFKTPVESQGYVAVSGEYLLYPAIYPTSKGNVMTFTITSPTINPSAAYAVSTNNGSFASVSTVATGAAPHVSFSDYYYQEARWGDYSAAVLDPNGTTVWLATEYIPPAADQAPLDNWGTYVFSVN